MQTRKIFFIFSLVIIFLTAVPGGMALAGSGEPPTYPSGGVISTPEAWAVVIVNIKDLGGDKFYTVTLRAKRVVDCVVQTDTLFYAYQDGCAAPIPCPVEQADFLNLGFTGVNLFGGAIPNPIITKIKNFVTVTRWVGCRYTSHLMLR